MAAIADRHAQSIGHQRCVLAVIDGPADNAPAEGSKHDTAVELAFTRGVFGYVGDPEPVGCGSCKVSVNKVGGGDDALDLPAAPRAWEAMDAGSRHQHLDDAVTGLDTSTDGEFGMNPAGAVGPARCCMNLDDLIGQPHMTDRSLRPPQPTCRLRSDRSRDGATPGHSDEAFLFSFNRSMTDPRTRTPSEPVAHQRLRKTR